MTIHLINEQQSLNNLISSLQSVSAFAIDLEFDRNRYRYGFNMCLMQIYDGKDCYLIDPLSKNVDIKAIFRSLKILTFKK